MTNTTELKRGRCFSCGRDITVKKDGTLRSHVNPNGRRLTPSSPSPYCYGSSEFPVKPRP